MAIIRNRSDIKDAYVRYLERKCGEYILKIDPSIEHIQEQTQIILDEKISLGLDND